MPITLSLEPESTVAALESVVNNAKASAGLMMRHDNGRLHVDVRPAEKWRWLKALVASGEVRDLGIYQPTLEDVYVHFIGSGGLAHRGGAQ